MSPEQAAVVAAARQWRKDQAWSEADRKSDRDLMEALDALPDARVVSVEASGETTIPYGQIVSEDQVWSENKGKWFEVLEIATKGGTTTFRLKGVAAKFTKPAAETVRVKRSAAGQAVDMFLTVDWSGVKS